MNLPFQVLQVLKGTRQGRGGLVEEQPGRNEMGPVTDDGLPSDFPWTLGPFIRGMGEDPGDSSCCDHSRNRWPSPLPSVFAVRIGVGIRGWCEEAITSSLCDISQIAVLRWQLYLFFSESSKPGESVVHINHKRCYPKDYLLEFSTFRSLSLPQEGYWLGPYIFSGLYSVLFQVC